MEADPGLEPRAADPNMGHSHAGYKLYSRAADCESKSPSPPLFTVETCKISFCICHSAGCKTSVCVAEHFWCFCHSPAEEYETSVTTRDTRSHLHKIPSFVLFCSYQ